MTDKHAARRPNPIGHLWALLVDAAFILLFALVGRASHDETTDLSGVLQTAWPFLVGMLVGALLVYLLRWRPTRPVPAGLLVWFLTLVLGMGLRAMTSQGTATAFVVVATLFLLLTLLGWRLLPTIIARTSQRGRQAAREAGGDVPQRRAGDRADHLHGPRRAEGEDPRD